MTERSNARASVTEAQPGPARTPMPAPPAQTYHCLPPIVGRHSELASLASALQDPDVLLITLIGPPGVGKSRLAREAASRFRAASGAPVGTLDVRGHDATHLAEAVQASLGAAIADAFDDTTLGGTVPDPVLLILDNCDAAPTQVAHILRDLLMPCPAVPPVAKFIVTSRSPLRMPFETLFAVQPLPVPARGLAPEALAEVASVALFLQRAATVRPGFAHSQANLVWAGELCRMLDGLPLGIEHAAARMSVFHPRILVDHLRENLHVLAQAREPNSPGGHEPDLVHALQESVRALPPEAADFLVNLAAFYPTSTFSLDAATAVCAVPGSAQHLLEVLIDASLVRVTEDAAADDLRFSLLRAVCLFARGLPDAPDRLAASRHRLARYYLRAVARCVPGTPDTLLVMLRREQANLVAALDTFRQEGLVFEALVLASTMTPLWAVSTEDRAQGVRLLRDLLAHDLVPASPQENAVLARALLALGLVEQLDGEAALARHLYDRARRMFEDLDDSIGATRVIRMSALAALQSGQGDQARELASAAMTRNGGVGRCTECALSWLQLALACWATGDGEDAVIAADSAAQFFRTMPGQRRRVLAETVLFAVSAPDAAQGPALESLAQLETLCLGAPVPGHDRCARRPTPSGSAAADAGPAGDRRRAVTAGILPPQTSAPPFAMCAFRPARATPARLPLTQRQREVAELVALGLTNREIARRLQIAEWTAVNHVRTLLRKFGCASRVQLARLVIQEREPFTTAGAPHPAGYVPGSAPAVGGHPHPPAVSRS